MSMDLSLYRIFLAVAEEESFVRAAARLYLTQPAVSQAVQRMEKQADTKLFVRSRRGVQLTSEGKILYEHASAAMAMLEAGERQLGRVQSLEAGMLHLGAADTITKEFLLPYLRAFRELHPGIQLQVTNRTSVELVQKVLTGKVDMAIVNLPVQNSRLRVQPILEVHDIFVAGPAFAHLRGKTLTPAELAALPLAMLERASNSRRYVEDYFSRQGVKLAPQIELGAHGLLPDFAAIGFGLSCVVQELCPRELEEGTVFPVALQPPIPPRSVGACWLAAMELPPAAREFLRLLEGARPPALQEK
ncbi:MAG TPA: LysR family transcriptional regulator [Candidatus Faecousia intestinigallinarum]|nr:LysR family transcriptional regulator [Candidatus Faecousia intestinigallinarum]